jgi:hypothetical protein
MMSVFAKHPITKLLLATVAPYARSFAGEFAGDAMFAPRKQQPQHVVAPLARPNCCVREAQQDPENSLPPSDVTNCRTAGGLLILAVVAGLLVLCCCLGGAARTSDPSGDEPPVADEMCCDEHYCAIVLVSREADRLSQRRDEIKPNLFQWLPHEERSSEESPSEITRFDGDRFKSVSHCRKLSDVSKMMSRPSPLTSDHDALGVDSTPSKLNLSPPPLAP